MTAVGKILVFMNLLLSVATSAMIVLVFTTRSNWKAEYEKMRNVSLVAEAAYKTEKLAHETDLKSSDSRLSSSKKTEAAAVARADVAEKRQSAAETELGKAQKEKIEETTGHAALKEEVFSLKKERDSLFAETNAQRARVLETQKELNEQRLLATTFKSEADTQTQRARRLLDRVEELERDNTQKTNRLVALGAVGDTSSKGSLLSPPPIQAPRDVYGTVRAVATSGLAVVNIGSDSGLTAGNKLFVYRADGLNSLYLGELIINRTEPKQAVGQFMPKPFAKPDERLPKENDVVSTSLGSR